VLSSGTASRAGLRRVDWVRLVVDHGHLQAEAVGIGFRLPVTRPISLSLAATLIASGTPHVTCSIDDRDAGDKRSGGRGGLVSGAIGKLATDARTRTELEGGPTSP